MHLRKPRVESVRNQALPDLPLCGAPDTEQDLEFIFIWRGRSGGLAFYRIGAGSEIGTLVEAIPVPHVPLPFAVVFIFLS